MRCGGVCHGCQDMAASLGQIRHLIPNMSRLARSRGSVSSGRDVRDAPADDASGEHSSHLHQIIPLQVILHQINLMRFDVWYKDLQPTLDISEQNRLRSKGWQPRQVGGQGALYVDDVCRHHHHHQDAGEAQATVARCLLGEWLDVAGAPQGEGAWKRSKPIFETSSIKASFKTCPRSPDHPPPHISDVPGADDGPRGADDGPRGAMTDPDRRCHNDLENSQ